MNGFNPQLMKGNMPQQPPKALTLEDAILQREQQLQAIDQREKEQKAQYSSSYVTYASQLVQVLIRAAGKESITDKAMKEEIVSVAFEIADAVRQGAEMFDEHCKSNAKTDPALEEARDAIKKDLADLKEKKEQIANIKGMHPEGVSIQEPE